MPIVSRNSLADVALATSTTGTLAVSAGPGAVPIFDSRLTWDADTATHTVNGSTVKPDTTPLHFKTKAGPGRRGLNFTYCTNGGHPFVSGDQTLYDDVVTWGWNLGTAYNSEWNPAYPTVYDTMESAYLTPAGQILSEYNHEGTFTGWPGARRWRGVAVDQADGHGNHVYWGDYHQFKSNSNQLSAFQVGVSTNIGFGPFGVYEVELTGALSDYNGMGAGYTDGTGYALIFTGGGGTGAAGLFDVVGGAVKNLSLSSPGSGYTSAPTVSFANAGPGTGATARVQIGSISGTVPMNIMNVVSGTQFWLGNTSAAQQQFLVAAAHSLGGGIYSGYNITEVGGTYQHLATGALSGVVYSSSGGVNYYVKGSQAAGTAVTPTLSLAANGSLTQVMNSSGIVHGITLPTTQTDDIIQIRKPDTTRVLEVTAQGYIGNNVGSGVTAPIDVTRLDAGNMAQFGANGVKSLCTISYGTVTSSDVTIAGSTFGPLQLKSGAGQDINLVPTTTGKIGLKGPIAMTDGKDFTFGATTGTKLGTAATQKLGFFGATPVVQPTLGAATAGATYGTLEQTMLQAVYDALRNLGLGS